jgi:hypothetical protein
MRDEGRKNALNAISHDVNQSEEPTEDTDSLSVMASVENAHRRSRTVSLGVPFALGFIVGFLLARLLA